MEARIDTLARWLAGAAHAVFFTGAGISTESGLPDFRGPDGLWTRRARGEAPPRFDWASARPGAAHKALAALQDMGRLAFLISQNVDNLHLMSGIRPELLAELHGNITKLRCPGCGFQCDYFPDLSACPLCAERLAPSVVDFGQALPPREFALAEQHSRQSDLFVVVGSSLVVYPAADIPRLALEAGARLVIINDGETPLDGRCHLRISRRAGAVLPRVVARLKALIANH